MIPPRTDFIAPAVEEAYAALSVLTARERVQFALRILLDIEDDELGGSLANAATMLRDRSRVLMRRSFERECG